MVDVECYTDDPDSDSVFTFCVEDILDYNNANESQDLHDYWTYNNKTGVTVNVFGLSVCGINWF